MRFLCLVLFVITTPQAFSSLTVYPTNAHFDQHSRTAVLSVKNTSAQATKYEISAIFYEATHEGKLVKSAPERFHPESLTKLIRFSPKSVTLKPHETQVVRILIKKDRRLKAGDYRAHIHFSPVEIENKNYVEKKTETKLQLQAKVAISIPALLRIEPISKELKLSNLKIFKSGSRDRFSVSLHKTNGYFPYGEFRLYGLTKEGKKIQLTQVKGIQAFKDQMRYEFPIDDKIDGKNFKAAELVYIETFKGQSEELAREKIEL